MKIRISTLECAIHAICALGLLTVLTAPGKAAQAPSGNEDKSIPLKVRDPELAAKAEVWRKAMVRTARPEKKCYTATYPDTAWHEVACKVPPHVMLPPQHGPKPSIVGGGGNGSDYVIETTQPIQLGEGSFDSVCNNGGTATVCNPSATVTESSPNGANQYSLQLNTMFWEGQGCNNFKSPLAGSKTDPCTTWEQFAYEGSGYGFIQYWFDPFGPNGTACPSGWSSFQFTPGVSDVLCFTNSSKSAPVTSEPITSLADMTLTGIPAGVTIGTTTYTDDWITITVGGTTIYTAPGDNPFPDLKSAWNQAEFNVFGDGGGDQASFNAGTTIIVRNQADSGQNVLPTCVSDGFTGETNNLNLVSAPTHPVKDLYPSIIFTESNATNQTPATCATSLGDTHITTFDSVHYNFQASGDFVLAQVGNDFVVHARQGPATEPWQGATLNKGIAVKMGAAKVELYVDPDRLYVNGKATSLDDNKSLSLAGGVELARYGSIYAITNNSDGAVWVELNHTSYTDPTSHKTFENDYINATIDLGRAPINQAKGLLGNPTGNGQRLVTAKGEALSDNPPEDQLYNNFGASWLVAKGQGLFTVVAAPTKILVAKPLATEDLAPDVAARAQATCRAAGVTDKDALDDCTLDTAVTGDATAAKVFVHAGVGNKTVKPAIRITAIPK